MDFFLNDLFIFFYYLQFRSIKDLSISKQTNINTATSQYIGKELVINGRILQQNLSLLHISGLWLQEQLQLQGIPDIKDVTIAILTPEGKVYADTKSDQ
ncbi:MAG: hypothetical protein K0Q53_1038 [Massilibacillus sp.]|jgi:uncharacterized membrane protein YcaP (DUF421 family)|nr:hypothetical protein [Massilibacillus sp.]